LTRIFKVEMAMIGRIRIEKGLRALDRQGPHDADLGKQIENIIDCRERSPHLQGIRFSGQSIGRHMPVAFAEKKLRETQPLTGRPEPIGLQKTAHPLLYGRGACRKAVLRKLCHGLSIPNILKFRPLGPARVKSVGGQPIHRLPRLTTLYRRANLFNAVAFRRDGLTPGAVRLMQVSIGFNPSRIVGFTT
jgi:hypothetical protein